MDLSRGILTGCDARMELFLPWWFDHYQRHNSFPVTIVDFGLSDWGKRVANRIGTLIEAPQAPTHSLKDSTLIPQSKAYFKERRPIWFSKPLSFLKSPFEKTLWIDLDCKIRIDLTTCFECQNFGAVAYRESSQKWAIEHGHLKPGEVLYNSGFIAFEKNTPLLKAWCDEVTQNGENYLTDDYAMTAVINSKKWPFTSLHKDYNTAYPETTEQTKIVHYMSWKHKAKIYEEMIAKTLGFSDE